MDTLLIHVLNSLLYASVLFLIAGGLSLIYGVMRIVNLARQPLCLRRVRDGLGGGQRGGRGVGAGLARAAAGGRARRGDARRDSRADTAPAFLPARRGIPAALHLRSAHDPRGRPALHLGTLSALGEHALRELRKPLGGRVDLPDLQLPRDRRGRRRRRLPLGLHLPDEVRRGAPRHLAEHAHGRGARRERQPRLHPGLHARVLHGGAGRRDHRAEPVGGARHGRGRAGARVHRGRHLWARQPRGRAGRRAHRRLRARGRDHVVRGDRAGGALPDRGARAARAAGRALRASMSVPAPAPRPAAPNSRPLRIAVPIAVLLALVPLVLPPYSAILLAYGLVMAIGALGFNLLLGYTGLLSFGHSAYFGVGAYAVAFMVKYLHVESMELFLLGAIVASILVTLLFGYVCVRYTKIFFSILTLALSQVLWSLAFKFFWVTGGTDGLRVPTPRLFGSVSSDDKIYFLSHGYYYYVLVLFTVCVGLMWLIVH